jgi:hypothetical protein
MKTTLVTLNGLSAFCAIMAAYFWWHVGREKTPDHKESTFDQTNFDWLTVPLANQAKFNKRAAIFAGLAALLQASAIVLGLCQA